MAVLFHLLFADGRNKDGHFDNVYVGSGRFSFFLSHCLTSLLSRPQDNQSDLNWRWTTRLAGLRD